MTRQKPLNCSCFAGLIGTPNYMLGEYLKAVAVTVVLVAIFAAPVAAESPAETVVRGTRASPTQRS